MSHVGQSEEILERVGSCGRFQMSLSILSHIMKGPTVFSMFLMTFSIATPLWTCSDGRHLLLDNGTLQITERLNAYYMYNNSMNRTEGILQTYNVSMDIQGYDSTKNCQNRNGTLCSHIDYGQTMNTIVSEWSMSCILSWVPSTIASVQMSCILIGNLVSGQLADSFGRKPPWLGSQLIIIVASLIGYFSTSWLMFACARALCGLGMGIYLSVAYTLATEVSLSKWRPMIIAAPSWPILSCLYSLINYFLPEWRQMHLLTALITIPCVIAAWLMPESFRWYLAHDRKEEAKKVIKLIAKRNKHPVSDTDLDELLQVEVDPKPKDSKKYTLIQLFRGGLARVTLLSMVNWLALGLVGYSIQFGIQSLSGNLFMNFFLFSVIAIPTGFISIFLCSLIGRRKTVILTYFVAFLGCILVGIINYIDTPLKDPLKNGLAMFASAGIGCAPWGPVQIVTLELYPTVVRNIGYGYLNTMARVGATIGPQLAYLDTKLPGVMYFICAGVSVCCIVGTLLLPETKGAMLEDKIQATIVIEEDKKDEINKPI